jgi:hypothetical protein
MILMFNRLKTAIASGLAAICLSQEARGVMILYDDFSSGSLNTGKWTESLFNGPPFPEIHAVNSGKYEIIQSTAGDHTIILSPNRQFSAGDVFQFDLTYNLGSGNNSVNFLLNNEYIPIVNPNPTPGPGSGTIGYWNGIPDAGNAFGTYNVKESFFSDRVEQTITRPDSTTLSHTFSGASHPYTFGINPHTGDNGTMSFSVDNAYINGSVPEPSATLLLGIGATGVAGSRRVRKKN